MMCVKVLLEKRVEGRENLGEAAWDFLLGLS